MKEGSKWRGRHAEGRKDTRVSQVLGRCRGETEDLEGLLQGDGDKDLFKA